MPEVTFHLAPAGRAAVSVTVADGMSVMRAAVTNAVPGIIGECGGQAMCATCHVLVREEFLDRLAPAGADEVDMLEFSVSGRDEARSRLGCHIHLGPALPALEVDIPASQYS